MFTFIVTSVAIVTSTLLARSVYNNAEARSLLASEVSVNKNLKDSLDTTKSEYYKVRTEYMHYRKNTEQEIKCEAERSKMHIMDLADRNKELRAKLKELQAFRDGILFSDLIGIKFTAHVPDKGWLRTEFKLGVGPCGKQVTSLKWEELEDRCILTQTCSDGERKEFEYKHKDISGRIEKSFKVEYNTTH